MESFDTFTEFEEKFGAPKAYAPIGEDSIARMRAAGIPAFYADYLQTNSLVQFSHGFWWFIDPFQMAPELVFLTGDENALPMIRTAFGNFIVLKDKQYFHADVQTRNFGPIGTNLGVLLNYGVTEDRTIQRMFYGKYFQEALDREGELQSDEMYAFTPALALGGKVQAGNAQRVKMREQIALLSQI